jgi:hypothetical protein
MVYSGSCLRCVPLMHRAGGQMNKRFLVWTAALVFTTSQSIALAQDAKSPAGSAGNNKGGTVLIAADTDNDRYVEPATPDQAVQSADGGLSALQWGTIGGLAAAIVAVLSIGKGSGSSGPTGTH